MAMEGGLSFSVVSVVEDVLQQHGIRSRGIDLESRKAEEAALRRYEAAGWLRKMTGVIAARDLPAGPSDEEFRLGLRSGLILCNILNKVQPGAVPKVVESSCDSALIPDGAALSAYQYFENVRNFLDAVQELGLPTFEASDLEQGGKTSRVVNCVLAVKSYGEWKQTGGIGVWKFGGNVKQTTSKCFVRKNSEPFTNSLSRTLSMNEKTLNPPDLTSNHMSSSSLAMLVRAVLLDKKPEEVPNLVESVLRKVIEEFEHRIASTHDLRTKNGIVTKETPFSNYKKMIPDEESKKQSLKQQTICEQQQRDIQELKKTLHATKAGIKFMQVKFHDEFNSIGVHIHGLAHVASGYHRVLEENRKLYNQVQDLKGSIRVYCRVRPFLNGQANYLSTVNHIEEGNISISTSSKQGKGIRSFNFNKVFVPSATQAEVFSDTQPLIRSVLDGFNVCIFAYGQTGSGKTFTMSGPKELTDQSQGVNYRALHDLFLLAEQRKDTFRYEVSVQMIEIYNEQVRDLLVTDALNKRLEIRNSSQTGLNVPDANVVPVSTTTEVIYLMRLGQKNRAVGATALNDRSSRSHSCMTVHVQGRDLTSGTVLRGCMHLVDLAGSERVNKSEVTGDRLKEAQHINKSLSALGDVIASLAQKNPHVPYRNSKLTQLLQDSLGGQAKTLMFVHISPEPDAVAETISTLKFAERVATVELGAARVNKDSTEVKDLKEQISNLKAALARKEEVPEKIQRSISGSSDRCKTKASEFSSPFHQRSISGSSDKCKTKASEFSSPFHSNWRTEDVFGDQDSCRQPMGDVGNIEVHNNIAFINKKQSFDLNEPMANSPPWPQLIIPTHKKKEEDKEMGSGEWVDKVMVNKSDIASRVGNSLECWEEENRILPDTFYTKLHVDQPYNVLVGRNHFDIVNTNDLDEDAGTSDSSEPDLLWKFSHSKLPSIPNGTGSKIKKPSPTPTKRSETSTIHSNLGPSPSQKVPNGVLPQTNRNGRQPVATNEKRKNVHKK